VTAGAAGLAILLAPLALSPYARLVVSYALVLAIAATAVNLLLGYTGLLSLGHAAYFGAGAYAGGLLYALTPLTALEHYLLVGVATAAALAALFGAICVRATRIHFTIFTLAFTQIVHAVFVSGLAFRPFGGFGSGLYILGGGGLYLPRFTMAGVELEGETFMVALYYVIAAAFFVSLALLWRIVHSPFGLALQAIRDDEVRAAMIGIRVRHSRWIAFVVSGVFTGLAGGLWGQLSRQVTPQQLHWLFSAELVLAAVLGGMRSFWGPVLGAFGLVALQELALRFLAFRGSILGVLLIAVVLGSPGGLVGSLAALVDRARRTRGRLDPTGLWRPRSGSR
jgi:branched-chain amino acid transport system permease protein